MSQGSLEDHLGYWMRRVSNEVSSSFARALHEHDVSVAEWVALKLISDNPEAMASALATEMGMTRGAIAKVLAKLEAKGWLFRQSQSHDRRTHSLVLSPSGRQSLSQFAGLADANDAHFFGFLPPEERLHLAAILQEICRFHRLTKPPIE